MIRKQKNVDTHFNNKNYTGRVMKPYFRHPLFISVLSCLGACSSYQVSVNDNVVYDPPTLFADYSISDKTLKECVRATISEQKAVSAEEIEKLICPAGNIKKVSGLQVFTNLKQIGLAGNNIKNITPLKALTKLQQADLSGNAIRDVTPLKSLKELNYINLSANRGLDCISMVNQISEASSAKVIVCNDL